MKNYFKQAAEDCWYGMMLPARRPDRKLGSLVALNSLFAMAAAGVAFDVPGVTLVALLGTIDPLTRLANMGAAIRIAAGQSDRQP